MKKAGAKRLLAIALLALSLSAMSGCDWIQYAFMNSIPFKGNVANNPDVYVYLAVDGLSYHTVQDAMKKGAFAGPEWKLSKFITMFPGTSDASWTRIMHTQKLGGYEIEYYDPTRDTIVNAGYTGLAKHVMPTISETFSFEFDYLKAFDYRANGFTHGLSAYRDTFISKADSFDNLFVLLSGRAETSKVFSAYLLEVDVLGHMQSSGDVTKAVMNLSKRIQAFRDAHPERRIHFTIVSDHGMDFIQVKGDRLIVMKDLLESVGVTATETLLDKDSSVKPYAIPIMHTRVTYIALHTHPDRIEEVAGRVSGAAAVDLAISKIKTPAKDPHALNHLEWYGFWSESKLTAYFGFDSQTNEYYLPADQNWTRLDLQNISFEAGTDFKIIKDKELFALSKNNKYPDLFYRARTSVSPIGVKYPADVMVSFRPTYASMGFKILGADDIASAGFHGAMEELGSLGTLLTTERDLPDAVRSDNFLELFPRMKEHMHSLHVETIDGDPNASIQY